LEKAPFLLLAAASCVITFQVQSHGGAVTDKLELPLSARVVNAIASYVKYLGKTIWPADLAVYYPHPYSHDPGAQRWAAWEVAAAALALALVCAVAVRWRRNRPWFAVGWFWYLGTLTPVIGIVQAGKQAMADRYTYIPLIGIFVVVVWGVAELGERDRLGRSSRRPADWPAGSTRLTKWLTRWTGGVFGQRPKTAGGTPALPEPTESLRLKSRAAAGALAGVAALAACGLLTHRQVGYWRDSIALFEHDLAVAPDNALAHSGLGTTLAFEGKEDLAIEQFRASVRADPTLPEARLNLGFLLKKRGDFEESAAEYAAAIRLKPSDPLARNNLGILLWALGRRDAALAQYQEAIKLKRDFFEGYCNLGKALLESGRLEEAIDALKEALRLNPGYARAHQEYGKALAGLGKLNEAAQELESAARLQPGAQTCYELASVRVLAGQPKEAAASYEQALQLDPAFLAALNDLAWLRATDPHDDIRNGAQAVSLAEKARDLSGGKEARYWGTLDAAYAEAGRWADAIQAARQAVALAQAAGEPEIAKAAGQRLALYQKQQPYRQ
jgi:tetratricopeptide (TPR) repeat protein